jgi:hypothetical protein
MTLRALTVRDVNQVSLVQQLLLESVEIHKIVNLASAIHQAHILIKIKVYLFVIVTLENVNVNLMLLVMIVMFVKMDITRSRVTKVVIPAIVTLLAL